MITTSGIIAAIIGAGGGGEMMVLNYHPVYLFAAIAFGSQVGAWMNDSGFWVISKMSGMTEKETLKALTPMATLMGLTGIIITMIAAKAIPMN